MIAAIPRGGVEVGLTAAEQLGFNFAILIARKLPFPHNPESGFGAITEDGSKVILKESTKSLTSDEIEHIISEQKEEIIRRKKVLRRGRDFPDIDGRSVILVDDGIAMGSTMKAAVKMCRNGKAKKIIVAVPVCSPRIISEFKNLVDDIMALETPPNFRAVAQVYDIWYDVDDQEVLELLKKNR